MCFTILDVKVPLKRESDFNNQTLCKALSQKITCVTVGWILVGSNQQRRKHTQNDRGSPLELGLNPLSISLRFKKETSSPKVPLSNDRLKEGLIKLRGLRDLHLKGTSAL
jgi:hypothetical protein